MLSRRIPTTNRRPPIDQIKKEKQKTILALFGAGAESVARLALRTLTIDVFYVL